MAKTTLDPVNFVNINAARPARDTLRQCDSSVTFRRSDGYSAMYRHGWPAPSRRQMVKKGNSPG